MRTKGPVAKDPDMQGMILETIAYMNYMRVRFLYWSEHTIMCFIHHVRTRSEVLLDSAPCGPDLLTRLLQAFLGGSPCGARSRRAPRRLLGAGLRPFRVACPWFAVLWCGFGGLNSAALMSAPLTHAWRRAYVFLSFIHYVHAVAPAMAVCTAAAAHSSAERISAHRWGSR